MVPLAVLALAIFYEKGVSNSEICKLSNSKWLIFLLILLLISVIFADVTLYSYNAFKVVLGFTFWYYIIVRITTTYSQMRALFVVLVLSHILLIFLNIQVITDPANRHYIGNNPFLGDGNDFALSVCIVLPMCFYLVGESTNFMIKTIFIIAMVLLILAIIGTQSRGGALALAAVFLYLWLEGRKKFTGAVLLVSLVLVVLHYAPQEYFDRLDTIVDYQQEESAQGRLIAWKAAIRMMLEHPLTGVGSGHFPVKFGTEFRPEEFGTQNLPWLNAHSVYFLFLGELGIPGILCLLTFLIGNFYRNKKIANYFKKHEVQNASQISRLFICLNASLIAFAVGGAFLSVAYYPHLYLLLGIFSASQYIAVSSKDDTFQNGQFRPINTEPAVKTTMEKKFQSRFKKQ
ncbi:O-antigen ligase family protein [Desulfofustis limnaeus]|uniref:Membrane protein n=1 Tax=Desulfofustis limnaeus TaxID=2740163 RepID=A0ABN6M846_9BACT|nr:O-antigen ligase family protein [Desulfofustis limnaeus]BDD87617.1 membrane protein [Desulfofustis limnaeus]